jgi:hypothetical protein
MSFNVNDFNNQPLPINRTIGYADPTTDTPFEAVGDEYLNLNTGTWFKASGKEGNAFLWTAYIETTGDPDSVVTYDSSGNVANVIVPSGSVVGNSGQGVDAIELIAGSGIDLALGANSITVSAQVAGSPKSWTPAVAFSPTQGTVTYNSRAGSIYYVQSFGSVWQVYVTAWVSFSISGSTGNLSITGLPLALQGIGTGTNCTSLGTAVGISAPASILGSVQVGYTTSVSSPTPLEIVYFTSAGTLTSLTAANVGANTTLQFSFMAITTTAP